MQGDAPWLDINNLAVNMHCHELCHHAFFAGLLPEWLLGPPSEWGLPEQAVEAGPAQPGSPCL
jgi:hypothetical protein